MDEGFRFSKPPPHSMGKHAAVGAVKLPGSALPYTLDASDGSDGVGASLGSIALVPRSATHPKSGIFDMFADVLNDTDAGPDIPLAVPKDTLVFDLAQDGDSQLEEAESNAVVQDVCKKEQGDLSTPQLVAPCAAPRASWFDVRLDDNDFSAFRFNEFGDIAEETSCAGHANFNSQDHLTQCEHLPQTQCGPLPHQHMPHTPCASHDADLTDMQSLRTQCGPLPQQHMPQTPCAPHDANLTDKQTLRTQCGPLPHQHMPQTPCAPLDFHGHAKVTLPDVYDSDAGSELSLNDVEFGLGMPTMQTQCGPLPQQHVQQTPCAQSDADLTDETFVGMQTLRTQCGPLPHQHMPQTPCAPLDADLTDMQTLRTQCGPLSQQHLPQTQCGPLPHQHMLHTPCASHDADLTDMQSLRTQCGPLPQQHMPQTPCAPHDADLTDKQTLRTQCGPMPHQYMPQTPCAPLDADHTDMQTLRTQCGPLPQQHPPQTQCGPLPQQHTPQTPCALDGSRDAPSLFDFEGITVFDFDVDGHLPAERTQQAPCAVSLPDFGLAGLQDTLAQLLATTCEPSASWDARYARLEAYAAANRQFELEIVSTKDPCPLRHASAQVAPSTEGGQAGKEMPQTDSSSSSKGRSKDFSSHGTRRSKGKGKGRGKGRHSTGKD